MNDHRGSLLEHPLVETTAMSLPDARKWCRTLARNHYENFSVGSIFLPARKREEYHALYAFARGADDLADEQTGGDDSDARLKSLNLWQRKLDALYEGKRPVHPAFIALEPVIQAYLLEHELFSALLRAFREDQVRKRYETWDDVLHYTSGSADPVGRLVLRLHGLRDPELDSWSDAVCTALQLVNFMQDIHTDYLQRDRIYIPREDLEKFKVQEADFGRSPTPDNIKNLLKFEAARAEKLFQTGSPLLKLRPKNLRRQLILFYYGGRTALDAMRRAGFEVASRHRRVSPLQYAAILYRGLRGETN